MIAEAPVNVLPPYQHFLHPLSGEIYIRHAHLISLTVHSNCSERLLLHAITVLVTLENYPSWPGESNLERTLRLPLLFVYASVRGVIPCNIDSCPILIDKLQPLDC